LGKLTARSFACEADLRGALAEASARLPFHRLVYLGVKEERKRGRVGRPPKGEPPLAVGYRPPVRVEVDQGKLERARRGLGRFLLATNVLDREALPAGEVLERYKDQTRTVERGFRFLKDPLFFASSTFLKRAERVMSLGMVMAVALWVYALGEWELRRKLLENQASLPDQKGKPTQRPTLRWVFHYVGSPGGAGGQAPGAQPDTPSRDGSPSAGGGAILPPGVRGVRNVGQTWIALASTPKKIPSLASQTR
jgi:transposase